MGSRGQYIASKGFALRFESNYHQVGTIEGIKVLQFSARPNSALPEYAKTSSAYFSINKDGEYQHLRIYENHYDGIGNGKILTPDRNYEGNDEMKTALEKLTSAISDDITDARRMLSFSFSSGGFEFEYMGRYYAYVHPVDDSRARVSEEYCWDGYDEMLSATISQTGKTVSAMLTELPDHDLEIAFDVPLQPGAIRMEC